MAFEQTRLDRPLSRLELAGTVVVIGILVTIFIHKILTLMVVAEATSVDVMIRNLRAGVMAYVAVQLVKGDYAAIATLANSNPIQVMETPFAGFIGAVTSAELAEIEAGSWAYDMDNNLLVYRVINKSNFKTVLPGPASIRIKFKLNYNDKNANGRYDEGVDLAQGVVLNILSPYEWQIQ